MRECCGHSSTFRGEHEDSCQVVRPGDCAHNHHSTFPGGFAKQCAPMVMQETTTAHFGARGRLRAKQCAPVAADGAQIVSSRPERPPERGMERFPMPEMIAGDFSTSLRSARNDMGNLIASLEMIRGPHCSARNDMGGSALLRSKRQWGGICLPTGWCDFAPSLEMTISAYAAAFWAILHSSAKPCGSLTAISASTLRSRSMPAVLRPCMKTE